MVDLGKLQDIPLYTDRPQSNAVCRVVYIILSIICRSIHIILSIICILLAVTCVILIAIYLVTAGVLVSYLEKNPDSGSTPIPNSIPDGIHACTTHMEHFMDNGIITGQKLTQTLLYDLVNETEVLIEMLNCK